MDVPEMKSRETEDPIILGWAIQLTLKVQFISKHVIAMPRAAFFTLT